MGGISGAGADGAYAGAEAPTVGPDAPIAIAVPDLDPRTRQPFTTNGLRRCVPISKSFLTVPSLLPPMPLLSCRAVPLWLSDMHVALLEVSGLFGEPIRGGRCV